MAVGWGERVAGQLSSWGRWLVDKFKGEPAAGVSPAKPVRVGPDDQPQILPVHERRAILDMTLMRTVGWTVERRTDVEAVLLLQNRINNVLHAVLTLLTCGVWLVIWLIMVATNKPMRMRVWVDEYGIVHREKAGLVPW